MTKPNNQRQDFVIEPPRKASTVTVELAEFNKLTPTTGIDNLWLRVKRSDDWRKKVKPLLNIGGLVRYPQGQGGLLLCQVQVPVPDAVPENAQKRRNIVTTLLRNLGAMFSGGKVVVAGASLTYEPVPLNEPCNLFLTKDKGWFNDEPRDLGHFPGGEQKFAGVKYQIRDFKTSQLPVAISLAGQNTKQPLPETVANIAVNKKAAALFFLQTWKQTGQWQAPGQGDKTPPVIWKYVVTYSDGKTVEVPVRYGCGVGHWVQKNPAGLPEAVVAWAAPFPGDSSGDQAVVYQMQWTNPRPEVEIASLTVAYDPQVKNQFGVPVVLAITAAKAVDK